MPIAVGNGSCVAQVSGNRRTKLEEPAPYALVGNIQTSLSKKILHIPIAQSEPGIEPNGASNDFRWKAVTFEGDGVHPKRPPRNHQIEIRALNVTMPPGAPPCPRRFDSRPDLRGRAAPSPRSPQSPSPLRHASPIIRAAVARRVAEGQAHRPALQGSHYRPWLRSGPLRLPCLGGSEKMGRL